MTLIILALFVGVVGAVLLSVGAWLIYIPAGYLVAGILCLAWSWLVSRSLAAHSIKKLERGD